MQQKPGRVRKSPVGRTSPGEPFAHGHWHGADQALLRTPYLMSNSLDGLERSNPEEMFGSKAPSMPCPDRRGLLALPPIFTAVRVMVRLRAVAKQHASTNSMSRRAALQLTSTNLAGDIWGEAALPASYMLLLGSLTLPSSSVPEDRFHCLLYPPATTPGRG